MVGQIISRKPPLATAKLFTAATKSMAFIFLRYLFYLIWATYSSVILLLFCTARSAPLWPSASILLLWSSLSIQLFFLRSFPIFSIYYAPPIFYPLAFTPFHFNLLRSFPSGLPLRFTHFNLLKYHHSLHAPLFLLWSALLPWIDLFWIIFLVSALSFASLGLQFFSSNNLQLGSISPSSSVYHNIEVINNLKIYFIVIVFTQTQPLNRNADGISLLNRNHNFYFFLAVLSKHKTRFWVCSKSNLFSKQNRGEITYCS